MKVLIYIIGLFLWVMVLSCEKQNLTPLPEPALGEAVAIRNGEIWKGEAHGNVFKKDSNYIGLSIDLYDPVSGYLRETIYFAFFNTQLLRKKISVRENNGNLDPIGLTYTVSAFVTIQDDGDVVGDWFDTVEPPGPEGKYPWRQSGNYLVLTDWDEEAGIAKARFQVTYERDHERKDGKITAPWLPDRLEFTEGYIHAKVKKY